MHRGRAPHSSWAWKLGRGPARRCVQKCTSAGAVCPLDCPFGSGAGSTHHPTPYTLHPTPYTLHPTPIPSRPIPYTLHPPPPSTTHLSQVGPLLACHVQHPKLASRHYRSGRLQEAQARLPTCTTHLHHPPPRCTCRRRAHLQKTCAICLEECIGPSLGPAADGSRWGAANCKCKALFHSSCLSRAITFQRSCPV